MIGRALATAIVAFTALTAPAQATVHHGTGTDPAGDSTASNVDIVEAGAQADDAAGTVAVALRFAATPAANAYYAAVVGTNGSSGCGAPYVVIAGTPGSHVANFQRDNGTVTPASIAVDGTTVVLGASDPAQLAVPFDCLYGAVKTSATQAAPIVDDTATIALAADAPPAPTPTPAPTAAPPAPTPVPGPTTATAPPVAVPKTAKLTVSLDGAPSTIKRNHTITVKLKITNDGLKKSSKVTVSFAKARGLSGVSKAKQLPALKPAQKRTLKLKVKLTKSARVSTTLKVNVRSGKLRTSSSLLLRIGKAKKVAAGGPKPGPETKKSPIVGTFWWRNVNHVDYAWDNRALYFVDGGAVYSGFPAGGLPATCSTPPAKPADEIDERDGCEPYTFEAASGTVTIGDKAGTFKDGKLTIDGNEYFPLIPAAPGARFTINDHEHTGFSGMCGLFTGCVITEKYLSLLPDGQFVLSKSTTASVGDPITGPYTVAGNFPPDQHGTYEVQAGGKIVLTYADGSVKIETFAVDTKNGVPDPNGEGVFIGEDNFYPDPTP